MFTCRRFDRWPLSAGLRVRPRGFPYRGNDSGVWDQLIRRQSPADGTCLKLFLPRAIGACRMSSLRPPSPERSPQCTQREHRAASHLDVQPLTKSSVELVDIHIHASTISTPAMALQEVTQAFLKRLRLSERPISRVSRRDCLRYASSPSDATTTTQDPHELDLEQTTFLSQSLPPSDKAKAYDPAESARGRKRQLPSSRYAIKTSQFNNPSHSTTNKHCPTDISSAPQSTTAALFTPINLPRPPTRPHANSAQAPSPSPVSNKPTTPQLPQTS